MIRHQAVVHGVVSKDEQTGVQEAADQNPGGDHQGMQLIQVKPQSDEQGQQPRDADQGSQLETAPRAALKGLTWHQA